MYVLHIAIPTCQHNVYMYILYMYNVMYINFVYDTCTVYVQMSELDQKVAIVVKDLRQAPPLPRFPLQPHTRPTAPLLMIGNQVQHSSKLTCTMEFLP